MFKGDSIIYLVKMAEFFDDYAHHPTEISAVLDGVRNVYKKRKLFVSFSLTEFRD